MATDRLLLIDGSSLLYRAYYALSRGGPQGSMATAAGQPTGAVFGFVTGLQRLLTAEQPTHVAIALDRSQPTVRHAEFPAYKANRKPMPDELRQQLPWVERAIAAHRIELPTAPRHEADDVLGTLARTGAERGLDVTLVSSDKDFLQLLGPRVSMIRLGHQGPRIRAEDVPAAFGVRPDQVADVLALWGDPTDNIPGVRGIGERGAKQLISTWGSLDNLLENLTELRPSHRRKLETATDTARLCRRLATIRTNLELDLDLADLSLRPADIPALHDLYSELELTGLLAGLSADPPTTRSCEPAPAAQLSLFPSPLRTPARRSRR